MNEEIKKEIESLEAEMTGIGFWDNKAHAQEVIKKIADLKDKAEGINKYDKGNAIMSIVSGAGGDDAEDFASMLLDMYIKYANKKGWSVSFVHEHKNEHGGYKNVTFELEGNPSTSSGRVGPYGLLKKENGVHRLVRISPFNAKKLRHTSFALVEVLPKFSKLDDKDFKIPESDIKIEYSKSGGPGGQNVNKRETAVRVVHIPSGLSVHSSGERSQEQNKERALSMLLAKIFKKAEEEKKSMEEVYKMNINTEIEWGNQIRSYVLHPYKMVKDHRTNAETNKVEDVLDGDLDMFIDHERNRPR